MGMSEDLMSCIVSSGVGLFVLGSPSGGIELVAWERGRGEERGREWFI